MAKRKKLTRMEQSRLARKNAMPEVKKLVRKHTRTTVQSCLNIIREHERKAERLEALKGEVSGLEKQLGRRI